MKNEKISKDIYINVLIAVVLMFYFILVNFTYCNLEKSIVLQILKVCSMLILAISIILMEIAFRKDNGKIAINSIEILAIACYTLSVAFVVEIQKLEFESYILISSYIFAIYFMFKAICIYTKEKKQYLNNLSDIREIVEVKPTKKEATKKDGKEK